MECQKYCSVFFSFFLALNTLACMAEKGDEEVPLIERLAALDRDLTPGSTGSDVSDVYEYLTTYGYFPNAELARDFPEWRPVISKPPTDPERYDETMERAVRALQKNIGIKETGVVDATTREQLRLPRCGHPDGVPEFDSTDKFAVKPYYWKKTSLTWKLTGSMDDGLARDTVRSVIGTGFNIWKNAMASINFKEVSESSTADITIKFGTHDGAGKQLAITTTTYSDTTIVSATMKIDTAEKWAISNNVPSGSISLEYAINHELGHALGLAHSSIGTALMRPIMPTNPYGWTHLTADDSVAIGVKYDTWSNYPGAAIDISASPNNTNGLWVIGTDSVVYQYSGGTWYRTDGIAVRIAVEPGAYPSFGYPWVVTRDGAIFRRTSDTYSYGSWELKPGCAKDIAIGGNGSVWVIGCSDGPNGGLYKWNGSGWDQENSGAAGTRIAVTYNGTPWHINSSNQIWQGTTSNPYSMGWTLLPGAAKDIAIAADNSVWVVGTNNAVYLWDSQPAIGDAPSRYEWLNLANNVSAANITAGPAPYTEGARPCITGTDNSIKCVTY